MRKVSWVVAGLGIHALQVWKITYEKSENAFLLWHNRLAGAGMT
jgi:hypothetical protein